MLDLLENFWVGRSWCADHFYPARILIYVTIFELFAKNCNLPLCSIFSHGGHVCWRIKNPNGSFVEDTLNINHTKFHFIWSSGFREEDFWKVERKDDGRQAMTIAHMDLWSRWAKNVTSYRLQVRISKPRPPVKFWTQHKA